MSFRQEHHQSLTLGDIFAWPDDKIIDFVSSNFLSKPSSIKALKLHMNVHLTAVSETILYLESLVTDGQYGYSNTRAEAIEKLHGWADGSMQEKVDESSAKLNDMLQQLSFTYDIPLQKVDKSAEEKEQSTKLGALMKQIGETYLKAESSKQKAGLILTEISRLEMAAQSVKESTDSSGHSKESKIPSMPAPQSLGGTTATFHQPPRKTRLAQKLVDYSKTAQKIVLSAYTVLVREAAEAKVVNSVAAGSKKTALYFALEAGQYERAKILLTEGRADVHVQTWNNDTALKLITRLATESPTSPGLKEILALVEPSRAITSEISESTPAGRNCCNF